MAQKPTVIIVGGAFQTAEFYKPLQHRLEAHGYPVVIPELPSCSNIERAELGKKGVTDDVASIQKELDALVSQSKPVAIAIHSYGAMPAAALKVKDSTVQARKAAGLQGGLERFIFFGSMAIPDGVTFRVLNGGKLPDSIQLMEDGTFNFLIAADTLLDELPPEEHTKWAAKITPQSQKVFDFACHDSAFRYAPVSVLILKRDKAVPAQLQEKNAQTFNGNTFHLDAGHGVHLAHPQLLADTISKAILDG